jgi:uncharacterized protein (TIGR02757 family)
LNFSDLKNLLDRLVAEYSVKCLPLDPLELVRKYGDPKDQEIAGFVAAALALGRAGLIRQAARDVLDRMGPSPYRFVRRFEPARDFERFSGFVYRFFRDRDVGLLVFWMHLAVREHGSLGQFFRAGYDPSDADVGPALSRFVQSMLKSEVPAGFHPACQKGFGLRHAGLRNFLADPAEGSACKRLNLFLRWMVRKDDLDLGIWRDIPTSRLVIPLDTHIARLGKKLGLTSRNTPDWKMALEITESLRAFDPIDPVKYDFALCTVGKLHACPDPFSRDACGGCPLLPCCGR